VRVLIQRVSRANVSVDGAIVGQIGRGFLLLVGVTHDDTEDQSAALATKIANLRVFDDEAGNLNRSAADLLAGSPESIGMLVVSQFTLYADTRKGRRPSFVQAAPPVVASPLVDHFANQLRQLGLTVEQGIFGAEMQVELVNDGPVTIWLDTDNL
jgi:D-tyrosyl-tRNA(Tyr) deacylase